MSTSYPHEAFALFMKGEEVGERLLRAPRNVADPVEAYADSLHDSEDAAIKARGLLTLGETDGFDVVVELVSIHEDGCVSTADGEYERSEIFAAWGVADDHAPPSPAT